MKCLLKRNLDKAHRKDRMKIIKLSFFPHQNQLQFGVPAKATYIWDLWAMENDQQWIQINKIWKENSMDTFGTCDGFFKDL